MDDVDDEDEDEDATASFADVGASPATSTFAAAVFVVDDVVVAANVAPSVDAVVVVAAEAIVLAIVVAGVDVGAAFT